MKRPTLGGQIRTFREHQGLVQAELAIRLGCSALLISRWERDEILPTTTELTALAEALGCRILISEDSISLIRVPRPEEPLNGHVRSRQGFRE